MSANVNGRLNMKRVSTKFVPQLLTEDQKKSFEYLLLFKGTR